MSAFVDQHQNISCVKASTTNNGSSDNDSSSNENQSPKHKRRNTLHIIIHATMQLLTSPSTSPTSFEEPRASPSSSITFAESSYFSFPEYETYDYDEINVKIDDPIGSGGEVENMVVQMVKFDEMLVNGVRVPTTCPI